MKRAALLLIALLCLPQPHAFGWGNDGHMAANRVATNHIPKTMPSFMRQAVARIAYLGPEPDRWRHQSEMMVKNAQEPDHFIDLERIDWLPQLPVGRYQFYQALYAKRAATPQNGDIFLPEKVGLQPYITMEIYDRLKVAFREYRRLKAEKKDTRGVEQNIVFYAGWMGHYVADGANPLHTTIHYNGWVGDNPKNFTREKIHWNFEGPFVAQNLPKMNFDALVKSPTRLANPFQDYMNYLRASHGRVEQLYTLEKAGAFKDAGTAEGREFVRQRLAAGSQMLLNLWYTAWEESAVPLPPPKYE